VFQDHILYGTDSDCDFVYVTGDGAVLSIQDLVFSDWGQIGQTSDALIWYKQPRLYPSKIEKWEISYVILSRLLNATLFSTPSRLFKNSVLFQGLSISALKADAIDLEVRRYVDLCLTSLAVVSKEYVHHCRVSAVNNTFESFLGNSFFWSLWICVRLTISLHYSDVRNK